LKDRDGRITLDLPFNGSLDDPEFNLSKVVYGAIETVLTKIATSPFSALAALFGGKGEELSFQEFQPGSTNLLPTAIANLDLLANALYERPGLQLEIEGSADTLTDLQALRREKLNERLPVQSWDSPLLGLGTNAAALEGLPPRSSRNAAFFEKGASALRSPVAYWSPFKIKSKNKKSSFAINPAKAFADDKGATALMLIFAPARAVADSNGQSKVLEAAEIPPDALVTLAAERARNVRAYLLQTGKVEPQRITESVRSAVSKGSRVYLWLQ
jgi:hypothetical protein